jgi:hypothetical protein
MVFNKKSVISFFGLLFLGCLIGSLAWEIVERIVNVAGTALSLSLASPLSLDLHVVAVSFRPNIGSILGAVAGIVLFFLL